MELLINILIYNALAASALMLITRINPRYVMQDYSKEIIKDVPDIDWAKDTA